MKQLGGGAHWDPEGTTFVVWTTTSTDVAVRLPEAGRTERLAPTGPSRFEGRISGLAPGTLYEVLLGGDVVPDPYARSLPRGVHGPAAVVAPGSAAPLASPLPPHRWVLYELHVGTFTAEGTYTAAMTKLDHLVDLGVTAIELMPLAAFDGHHGWGYDGVALFAPHGPYGTADELRAFVAAAHARGLAVVLDAVYNHFGPAGNYLSRYAPQYFSADVHTPWGAGPDFTWPPMRQLMLDNVRYWFDEYGFDGLRLDATHAIEDASAKHLLTEITDLAHERGRIVFFEDERNDPAMFTEHHADGVWADDLHHQIHVLLTGERDGYYSAYEPTAEAIAECICEGWMYRGQPYAPWKNVLRGKPRGDGPRAHLVTCIQNHDQVGNRAAGTRLNAHVDIDAYNAAAALLLFLPTTPLLFMGQEWAASTPFLFFSDHEGDLGRAVSEGRKKEFAGFAGFSAADVPDPQARTTFERSQLRWEERGKGDHARALDVHRALLRLRREDPVLSQPGDVDARALGDVLTVVRGSRQLIVDFGKDVKPPAGRVLFQIARAVIVATD